MNIPRTLAIVTISSLMAIIGYKAFSGPDVGAPASPGQIGRYQLVAATVLVHDTAAPRLFRIDTATGLVCRYASVELPLDLFSNHVPVELEAWDPIPEKDITSQSADIFRTLRELNLTNASHEKNHH